MTLEYCNSERRARNYDHDEIFCEIFARYFPDNQKQPSLVSSDKYGDKHDYNH